MIQGHFNNPLILVMRNPCHYDAYCVASRISSEYDFFACKFLPPILEFWRTGLLIAFRYIQSESGDQEGLLCRTNNLTLTRLRGADNVVQQVLCDDRVGGAKLQVSSIPDQNTTRLELQTSSDIFLPYVIRWIYVEKFLNLLIVSSKIGFEMKCERHSPVSKSTIPAYLSPAVIMMQIIAKALTITPHIWTRQSFRDQQKLKCLSFFAFSSWLTVV